MDFAKSVKIIAMSEDVKNVIIVSACSSITLTALPDIIPTNNIIWK